MNLNKRENRSQVRKPFYTGDVKTATLIVGNSSYKCEISDSSPSGIGLILPWDFTASDIEQSAVQVNLSDEKEEFISGNLRYTVVAPFSGRLRVKVGIEFSGVDTQKDEVRGQRFDTLPDFPIVGYIRNGSFFSQNVFGLVRDFSFSGLGMEITRGELGLLLGSKFLLMLDVSGLGKIKTQVNLENIREVANGKVRVGLKFLDISQRDSGILGQYLLLTHPNFTLKEIRQYGFSVYELKSVIQSRLGASANMEKILKLRLLSSQEAGRFLDKTDWNLTRDKFDDRSRQIEIFCGTDTVAAARVVFNQGKIELSEHHGYGVKIPKWIIKSGFVEFSRVCTHPDYRGADLFELVLQHCGYITVASGFRYALVNCEDTLVPIYKRFGCKELKYRFKTEFMEEKFLNLMVLDVKSLVQGTLNPLAFVVMCTEVTGKLIEVNKLLSGSIQESMLGLSKIVKPTLQSWLIRKKHQKHNQKTKQKFTKMKNSKNTEWCKSCEIPLTVGELGECKVLLCKECGHVPDFSPELEKIDRIETERLKAI